MNLQATSILLALSALLSVPCAGQAPVHIPKEFVETVPPEVGSDEWNALNFSENDFSVRIVDGELEIKRIDEVNDVEVCELRIPNGRLVGINRFEKGGTLSFEPSGDPEHSVEIKQGNIKFVFTHKGRIYFIEGLEHLSTNSGALYELEHSDDSFTYNKRIDFDDAPEAFTLFQDKFLIATHGNFYAVHDLKEELVFKATFWSGLYPNSIAALDEENVFIGMRSGVVKLDLAAKTLKFYRND
jgi:hypothetical protein